MKKGVFYRIERGFPTLVTGYALLSGLFLRAQDAPGIPEEVPLRPVAEEAETEWEQEATLLGVGRDLFLRRAAFDFNAGFFRVRGLDSRERELYLNGLRLNSPYDGRPQWQLLGGLTDIGRNAEELPGRAFTHLGFGGIAGVRHLQAFPSALRPGFRITASAANRTYQWRQMATYNSGIGRKGWGLLLSFGHRSGTTGYTAGTPYTAVSAYGALEWKPSVAHSLFFSIGYPRYRRGTRAALTEEASTLLGHRYNPNWGFSGGRIRPTRERFGQRPALVSGYRYKGKHTQAHLSAGFFWGREYRSRLAYFDGPNPDPVYYRNLPSYYHNRSFGPNFQNAVLARESLLATPQVNWLALEQVNRFAAPQGPSVYLQTAEEQIIREGQVRAFFRTRIQTGWTLDAGFEAMRAGRDFSDRILDLLGASHHVDRDPFSETKNDMEGPGKKGVGARINYSYRLDQAQEGLFLQTQYERGAWDGGVALRYGKARNRRTGYFRNERYPETSAGEGPWHAASDWGVKGRLGYRASGRLWLIAFFGRHTRPALLRESYSNPRDNHRVFSVPGDETFTGGSVNLHLRHPSLKGRVTLYSEHAEGARSLRSYYAETAFGSVFIRELAGDISSRHQGLEWGLEFQASAAITLAFAGALASNRYASNPKVELQTHPGPERPAAFTDQGIRDLGMARLKGYRMPSGPERAMSISIGYRDPKYWWVELRAVYLGRRYLSPAILRYTDAFLAEAGQEPRIASGTPSLLGRARSQPGLPSFYLLNMSLGKSWLKNGHYLSLFLGLNNLFDLEYRTGGYHQGRKATYRGWEADQRSGNPSFGPKYYQGTGRTYFLNLAWSF